MQRAHLQMLNTGVWTRQTVIHRVGLDKIQLGKVLGESPQIQILNEIDQPSPNTSGIRSTQQHNINN